MYNPTLQINLLILHENAILIQFTPIILYYFESFKKHLLNQLLRVNLETENIIK